MNILDTAIKSFDFSNSLKTSPTAPPPKTAIVKKLNGEISNCLSEGYRIY